jgi:uncharacterized membrane protein (DUF373 family)
LNTDERLRTYFSQHLLIFEAALYVGVGIVLSIAAAIVVGKAGVDLWQGFGGHTLARSVLILLDDLLLVLMLVEILHTVRISLQSQILIMEPFLIVGLIATIRRVLVITAKLAEPGQVAEEKAVMFRDSMIELGVLAALILVFVFSIYWLRRTPGREVEVD